MEGTRMMEAENAMCCEPLREGMEGPLQAEKAMKSPLEPPEG